jgi:hypothetical protein
MWPRLFELRALQLSVLLEFETFACSKCSLIMYERDFLHVVNFVD